MTLYAIFRNSGIKKKESIALLSLLDNKDIDYMITLIDKLMDGGEGCQFSTETELLEMIEVVMKGKK